MTAERFRQVRNVFDAAMDQPDAERAAWLASACQGDESLRGEVDELLRQHNKRSGVLDTSAAGLAEFSAADRMEGRRVGAWEILREIGRGGMGVVYLASRADGAFQMSAAIKVLSAPFAGEEIQKRFRQEREILAQLSHPNIARLLDGGTTDDGLPFLVMEFVSGQPLTDWCDEQRSTIGERLELLEQLCNVVDYLHRNKVIHRDLKPANVLVDSAGKLKLLDFGISKLLGPLGEQSVLATRSGLHLLTPEYASPEQVMGEPITPQTDIYALGVIAYELLSGHRPYNLRSRAMHIIMRAICEEQPERPSSIVTQTGEAGSIEPATIGRLRRSSPEHLSERLRGDLDEVVMKALRKEPAQRYRNARELAEDLSAQREGRPVVAQGESTSQRLLRRFGRHRLFIALAAAAIVLLATGAITIHARAIVYGLAAMAVFAAWRTVADAQVRRILTTPAVFWCLIVALVVGVYLTVTMVPANHSNFESWYAAVFSILIVVSLAEMARWILRERWLGKLLLDASTRQPAWQLWLSGIGLALIVMGAVGVRMRPFQVCQGLAVTLGLLRGVLLNGRLELRQKGIIGNGISYAWDRIEAWNWDNKGFGWSGRNTNVLRLKIRGKEAFGGTAMLPTSPVNYDDLSSVMNRFVGGSLKQDDAAGSLKGRFRPYTPHFAVAAVGLLCLAIYTAAHEEQLDRFLLMSTRALLQPRVTIIRNPIDGLEYAHIPAGSFLMGCSPDDDQCDENEKPAREVTINRDYWMGTTEVTNAAYSRFMTASGFKINLYKKNPDYPVVSLTWNQAKHYCAWASLRLPSEAEWEYAARAGTTGPRYGLLSDIAQRSGNQPPIDWDPYPVARKQPNAWGLYDVLGNVREWTADGVVRGGGHRVSERINWDPLVQDHVGGFRCAGQLR